MSSTEVITLALSAVGVVFMVVAAVGIVRLPDIYARMHAAGKATVLGVSCILLAAGLYFGGWVLVRMLILIALFLITGPIASTVMGRAAYRSDRQRMFTLHIDELADHQAKTRGAPTQRAVHRG